MHSLTMLAIYRSTLILGVVLTAVSPSRATELKIVSPSNFAETEGEAVTVLGDVTSYRLQQIFASSEFADLQPGESLLTEMTWRPDGPLVGPERYTAAQWLVRFSTTSAGPDPSTVDATFDNNFGDDATVVLDRSPHTIQTQNIGPAGGPKAFDYRLVFDTPFRYDPSRGNLLWDLTIVDGPAPLSLDFTIAQPGTNTAFHWSADMGHDSTISSGPFAGGDVLQFTFVPEPMSLLLTITGAIMLASFALGRTRREPSPV